MLATEVNSLSRELGVMSGLTGLWTDHFGLGLGGTGIGTENWTGPSQTLSCGTVHPKLEKLDGKSSIPGKIKVIGAKKIKRL
jgi:hypothetical protein